MAPLTAVDQYGRTALHHCATNDQTLVIDLLLRRWLHAGSDGGSLLEMRDCDGLTALAHAVITGNQAVVEHLLVLGADVSCHDNERHTVMHFATGNNYRHVTRLSVCEQFLIRHLRFVSLLSSASLTAKKVCFRQCLPCASFTLLGRNSMSLAI